MDITLTSEIKVGLIDKMGSDAMIALAARVSTKGAYTSGEGEIAGLINYLMKHRHGTPFEHSAMTFFVHAPIFVWREWHRHRIGFSYNEESARYKPLDPVFWIPAIDRKILPKPGSKSARPEFIVADSDDQHRILCLALRDSYEKAYKTYETLLELGYAREVARACLPVGIYSSCWVTCNPRSLMAFLSLRTHDDSATFVSYPQAEIETAARLAETILEQGWPLTHKAFVANGRVGP